MLFKSNIRYLFLLVCLIYVVSATRVSGLSRRASKSNVKLIDCGNADDILDILDIKVTPDIVKAGSEITIEASAIVKQAVVSGAVATMKIKSGGVTVFQKSFNICQDLEKYKVDVSVQCPLEEGDLNITQKITLPEVIPTSKFTVEVSASSADEEPLGCLEFRADFRKP